MRIIWLKSELLHPVDKGGRIRTYQMLRSLKRLGHQISYLALHDGAADSEAIAMASEYCDQLILVPHKTTPKSGARFFIDLFFNIFSVLPYALSKYRSRDMERALIEAAALHPDAIYVCDFLTPSVNIPTRLRASFLLFEHNVESLIWRRHYDTETNWIKKCYHFVQWYKMDVFERKACREFRKIVAVSTEDRRLLTEMGAIDVGEVSTGVDTEYFSLTQNARRGSRLVFTGSMDWLPNDDAMLFFINAVLPILRRARNDMELNIVGRNPSAKLIEKAQKDPKILISGRVDDVRPFMEAADVFIVPIRIGGGTRLKVYEAMSMGLPVVSTHVGVEGLPVVSGRDVVIADQAEELADAILAQLNDPVGAAAMAVRGSEFVRAQFSWDKVTEKFADILAAHSMANRTQMDVEL